ncbi:MULTISPECIES: hypothetical protein [Bacillus cereus group]|uniref:hypothetical protein n=1 Tax=Bacillus cereus group TaxID=86661 RepID=UPI0022E40C2A|nr:hypothetical protein [Bacillus cereus group sp. TH152-1LC]MDA1675118.1 hypothetical protein [Bacillus cereus group sp. TH152-1LC]
MNAVSSTDVVNQNVIMIERMKENAVKLLQVAFQLAGNQYIFRGDYSEQDLISLEECFNHLYPLEEQPPLTTTFIPFGFYLGEALVQNIPGAKWNCLYIDEGDLFGIKVTLPTDTGTIQIRPFQWVRNFWFNRDGNFVELYRKHKYLNKTIVAT